MDRVGMGTETGEMRRQRLAVKREQRPENGKRKYGGERESKQYTGEGGDSRRKMV